MSAETPNLQPIAENAVTPITVSHPVLEDFLMTTLEQLDGFCLDNESDRAELVPLLAAALIQATQSGDLVLGPFPFESGSPPPETSGSSATTLPAE